MRKLPAKLVLRYLGNVYRARFPLPGREKLVKPMLPSLFLTMGCNFRCTYCDDYSGQMYPERPKGDVLDTQRVLDVIDVLRRASHGLNLTGGEPLLRADIDTIVEHVGSKGFDLVTFNTNAFLLDRHMGLLDHVDYLVVSLDAVDELRGDRLIGLKKPGQTRRVLENLDRVRALQREGHPVQVVINTVVTPEGIHDAWDVFEYCLEQEFHYSPNPHLVGVYPHPKLIDNPEWIHLIDEVARAKRAGARVFPNSASLRIMRDFTRYECFPTLRPSVYPSGDLLYPCAPLGTVAANLLETGDYHAAVEAGLAKHGPLPSCDDRCQLTCYSEPSTLVQDPLLPLGDLLRGLLPRRKRYRLRRPRVDERPEIPTAAELRDVESLPPAEVRRRRRSQVALPVVAARGRPLPLAG